MSEIPDRLVPCPSFTEVRYLKVRVKDGYQMRPFFTDDLTEPEIAGTITVAGLQVRRSGERRLHVGEGITCHKKEGQEALWTARCSCGYATQPGMRSVVVTEMHRHLAPHTSPAEDPSQDGGAMERLVGINRLMVAYQDTPLLAREAGRYQALLAEFVVETRTVLGLER